MQQQGKWQLGVIATMPTPPTATCALGTLVSARATHASHHRCQRYETHHYRQPHQKGAHRSHIGESRRYGSCSGTQVGTIPVYTYTVHIPILPYVRRIYLQHGTALPIGLFDARSAYCITQHTMKRQTMQHVSSQKFHMARLLQQGVYLSSRHSECGS